MPETRINAITEAPSQAPISFTPAVELPPVASAPVTNAYSGVALTLPLNLPEGFSIQLPDIAQLGQLAIGTADNGFAPSTELPRVSDADREVHAVIFREQVNAAANLKDSISVATAYVDAAVEATKLGRGLVRYATGLEGIRTEQVKLQQAEVKTAIATAQLDGLNAEHTYLTQENAHKLTAFNEKLAQWGERVRMEQLKTAELTHSIDSKYAAYIQPSA